MNLEYYILVNIIFLPPKMFKTVIKKIKKIPN